MIVCGLVSTSGSRDPYAAAASLSDCDQIVLEDDQGKGQAWVRNRLASFAPTGSIVRYCDDDDVAMSTRRAAERLAETNADVLAFSFISGSTRVRVPEDALAAAVDSVGPWSWVARVEALRRVPWDPRRASCTGTWQWLAMMDAGLKFAFAPDIWGYHWAPNPSGVTSRRWGNEDLFAELETRIRASGRLELLVALERRKARR